MNSVRQSVRSTIRYEQLAAIDKSSIVESSTQTTTSSTQPSTFAGASGRLLRSLEAGSRHRALGEQGVSARNDADPATEKTADVSDISGVTDIASAAVRTAITTDSSGLQSAETAIATDSSGLEAAKTALKENLTQLASDPEAFHLTMRKSFGDNYDQTGAETIRAQILDNDFSWMPDIKIVHASVLQDQSGIQGEGESLGAYNESSDTIYISKQLLNSDPDKALQILTEEVGHGLDARLNATDTAGDEGDVFARLAAGEEISDTELASLKAENDSGVILVEGKEVEVEYGHLRNWRKKAKKAAKSVTNEIKRVGRKIDDNVIQPVKEAGKVALRGAETFLRSTIVRPFQESWNMIKGYAGAVKQVFKGDWKEAGRIFRDTTVNAITAPVRLGLEGIAITVTTGLAVWDTLRGDLKIRKLDDTEIAYLKDIYGNSIDYSKVRIHSAGSKDQLGMRANVVGNDIFLPRKDGDKAVFNADGTLTPSGLTLLGHEAAHVWQYQNEGTGYIGESLLGQINNTLFNSVTGAPDPYAWRSDVASGVEFEDLGPEQQAEVAELIGEALGIDRARQQLLAPGIPVTPTLTRADLDEALGVSVSGSTVQPLTDTEFGIISRAHEHLNR